jgi:lipid-binding SYLF domain-containing protein
MALVFMTPDALQRFQNSSGWDVGADAEVAVVKSGGGGKLDASQLTKPVQVFVYGNKGLMGSLSLEGTKISKSDI